MNTIKCENCGSSLPPFSEACPYCGSAVLPVEEFVSDYKKQQIIQAIRGWEKMLEAAKGKYDLHTGAWFLLISVVVGVLGYYMYHHIPSPIVHWGLILLSGLIGFILFGTMVQHYERKAIHEIFESRLSEEITAFLRTQQCSKQAFKSIAGSVIKPEGQLAKLLLYF